MFDTVTYRSLGWLLRPAKFLSVKRRRGGLRGLGGHRRAFLPRLRGAERGCGADDTV
jgi:hypothetical protein